MAENWPEAVSLDPESWVDEYGAPLFRYAMLQVRDENVAEDLVQETFLAALRGHKSFSGRSSFLTWLTSILRRKAIDYHRFLKRQGKSLQPVDPEEDICGKLFDSRNRWRETVGRWPTDPDKVTENVEFWEVLERCIERLPRPLAEAFRMREILSWEVSEVCETVGISSGNLAVRLHRARLALRTCLEERWFN